MGRLEQPAAASSVANVAYQREVLPAPTDRSRAWHDGEPAYVRWVEALLAERVALRQEDKIYDLSHEVQSAGLLRNYGEGCLSLASLRRIARIGPIHEYGAGLGYNSRLLSDIGADVVASDPAANGAGTAQGPGEPWFETLKLRYGEGGQDGRVPLLVWPFENAPGSWLASNARPERLIIADGRPSTASAFTCAAPSLFENYVVSDQWSADIGWRTSPDFIRVWERKQ